MQLQRINQVVLVISVPLCLTTPRNAPTGAKLYFSTQSPTKTLNAFSVLHIASCGYYRPNTHLTIVLLDIQYRFNKRNISF